MTKPGRINAIDVVSSMINANGTRPKCLKCGRPDVLHFVPGPCLESVFDRPNNPTEVKK